MRVLVSACLLGARCRYDGASKPLPGLERLLSVIDPVPVCPEQLGGLPTPRTPAERCGDRVVTRDGTDVTAQYERGAQEALRLARTTGCTLALLKEKSPSCGCGRVYDGTHTGALTNGNGVTAELLLQHGVRVFGETQLDALLDSLAARDNTVTAKFDCKGRMEITGGEGGLQ